MSVGTIILIILVIALLGGFSGIGGGPFYGTGYYGRRRPRPRDCYSVDPASAWQDLTQPGKRAISLQLQP